MIVKSFADVYLEEADELLSRGDIIQSCEKYYKAAENFLKYIAIRDNIVEILNEVQRRNY